MFDKEFFRKIAEKEGSLFATGVEMGCFEYRCLNAMRTIHRGDDLAEGWAEDDVEISRKIYDGIMSLANARELIYRYFVDNVAPECDKNLSADWWRMTAEESFGRIVNKFTEELKDNAT